MSKLGEFHLVFSDEDKNLLTEIRDLLRRELELTGRVLDQLDNQYEDAPEDDTSEDVG